MRTTCPRCGHTRAYQISTRNTLKCTHCGRHYSDKSAGPYRSSKLSLQQIAQLEKRVLAEDKCNVSAIARDFGLSYRGAYYIVDRIRTYQTEQAHDSSVGLTIKDAI